MNITLNLLRSSCIQPKLSAYAQIHGAFDFNATPLAPAGCKTIIHDRTNDRRAWATHGTVGFYIGPAINHYRNYRCYIPSTHSTRISNTVEFFPACCDMPTTSISDRLIMILEDLLDAITKPSQNPPHCP